MRSLAVLVVAAACTVSSRQPAAAPLEAANGLAVHGQADYDWPLRTPDGRSVSLADYRGRVLFINMWATWCAPCVAELASIERLRDSLTLPGVEFLLVSPEDAAQVSRFLRLRSYDLPIYLEAAPMPDAFGLTALPTTFVIDRNGRIVLRHRGAADWDRPPIRELLHALAVATGEP